MSSWTNYGFSALSNVTQSVQALSSYAQVVLHEARQEVESELLGQDNSLEAASPTPNDHAQSTLDDKPVAFASRAHIISPPRPATASRSVADDDYFSTSASASMVARADANFDVEQLQAYVRTLESQLAGKRSSDAATHDVALTLQRREEECFELHRKLEMLQQQLEDGALENKLLLQAVSQKAPANASQPPASNMKREDDHQQQQQQQQQQQDDQRRHLEHQLDELKQELAECRSQLSSANAASAAANEAASQCSSNAAAAASSSAAQIEAQARVISRLEADIDRMRADGIEAENSRHAAVSSRQAALAAAAAQDSEVLRLREMLAAAEASSKDATSALETLQREHAGALQQLAEKFAGQEQLAAESNFDMKSDIDLAAAVPYEQRYLESCELNRNLANQVAQLEAAMTDHMVEADQRAKERCTLLATIEDLNARLEESAATVAHLQNEEKLSKASQHVDVEALSKQIEQLQREKATVTDQLLSSSQACQTALQENSTLTLNFKSLSDEVLQLRENSEVLSEKHAREVAELVARCSSLDEQRTTLQADNERLMSKLQQQQQSKSDGKELAAAKRELENYAQAEGKFLLELNRRLGLAKRCSELSQHALAALSKCSEVPLTPTTSVEDQPSASVSPSAVLSILGKFLDNFVLRLMDLKKISESLSVSVPAMKTDCDRLMSKILDLERLRAEWSEGQGELMQTKSALASQMKQQQSHNQTEAHVLSVLQSCGGVVQGEQLAQAAVRITEELKTARMTVSELARQVEVERSSSSSRNRVADSHGSELRASLAAAEQRHAAELSATKSQLRKSELQCQQVQLELQAVTKLNAELNEQVNVFESVLAEKDAEVVEVSQQLQLARALVTSLSEQTEAAVNLELVRARKRAGALETQLQDALDAKTALEADIKMLQALPAQIRDLEVLCARKDRELSLSQVATAQAQEELKMQNARTRCEAFMVDRRLVSNLLVQYIAGTSGRKAEVLKLMAQVLEFDEDTQRRVGLSGGGWLTWLSGSQAQPSDETQNIGDMWVKFLLESAKPDGEQEGHALP